MMMGTKISAHQNITFNVYLLDDASQRVKLMSGWVDDGRTNGNRATPAVKIMQATEIELVTKASKVLLMACNASVLNTMT